MKYPYVLAAVVFLAVVTLFTGCGGGGNEDPIPVVPPQQFGSATFVVSWPSRTKEVPVAANSLNIKIKYQTGGTVENTVNRPVGNQTSQVLFNNVPMGVHSYEITAYDGTQKSGVTLGTATGSVYLKNSAPAQTVFVNSMLRSTITRLSVYSETGLFEVPASGTLGLFVLAYDSADNQVPIGTNCVQWSSLNEEIATIDPTTGLVTGQNGGTTKITVRETESNASTSIDLLVHGFIAKLITPVTTGTTTTLFPLRVEAWTGIGPSQTSFEVRWDFDGDGVYDTQYFTRQDFDHHYTQPGTYNLGVQIKDALGRTATATRVITVDQDPNPIHVVSTYYRYNGIDSTAGFYYFWLDQCKTDTTDPYIQDNNIYEGYIRFDWDNDSVYDTEFLYFRVNPTFYDNYTLDPMMYPYIDQPVLRHRFDTVGTKVINVQVKDNFGRVGVDTFSIVIPLDVWNP